MCLGWEGAWCPHPGPPACPAAAPFMEVGGVWGRAPCPVLLHVGSNPPAWYPGSRGGCVVCPPHPGGGSGKRRPAQPPTWWGFGRQMGRGWWLFGGPCTPLWVHGGRGAPSVGSLQRRGGCGAGEEAVPVIVWGCPPLSVGAALAGAVGQAAPWGRQAGRLPGSRLSAGLPGFASSSGTLPAAGSCRGTSGDRTVTPLPHGAMGTPQPLAPPGC